MHYPSLGCPRCADAGRISGLNRLTRRAIDPDLASLIQAVWDGGIELQGGVLPVYRRLLARSGSPHDVPGYLYGGCHFVHDGRDELLAAFVYSPPRRGGEAELCVALFDRDGALRDLLVASCPEFQFQARWSERSIQGRGLRLFAVASPPPVFRLQRGSEIVRIEGVEVRLRAVDGRFEVVR
jgi:hypothetical protein